MFDFKLNHHAIILGSTQTGKTTTAVALAQIQAKHHRAVFFVNTKADKKFFKCFNARKISIDFCQQLLDNELTGVFEIRPDIDKKELLLQIEPYIDLIIKYKKDNQDFEICLFIDEIHMFQSKASLNEVLKNLWTMGLGLKLYCVGISQRPTQIHNTIWTQSDIYFLHALNQKDLKYLYENRYLAIPDDWLIPLTQKETGYPFISNGISHTLFIQTNPTKPLVEIPLERPPF